MNSSYCAGPDDLAALAAIRVPMKQLRTPTSREARHAGPPQPAHDPSNAPTQLRKSPSDGDDDDAVDCPDCLAFDAIEAGDPDALRDVVSRGLTPQAVVECLHLVSEWGDGADYAADGDTIATVIAMAGILLPLLDHGVLLAAPRELNPWYVIFDAPELLDLLSEHHVPMPKPSTRMCCDLTDLACFYIDHDTSLNLARYVNMTGRNVSVPSAQADTLLLNYAARKAAPDCAHVLIVDLEADVNATHNGRTALDEVIAATGPWTPARIATLEVLVEAGADTRRQVSGQSPLERIRGKAPDDVLRLLGGKEHTDVSVRG